MLRQVLVTVVGHVDHGKSSLLDYIRGTNVVSREAGAITQAIGASIIPLATIKKICGPLFDSLKTKQPIPGILAIDTPGHAAFTNLRKRGGGLADIAIVVVDINEGFMPQTREAIEILRQSKTPFIIAANKIDLVSGWKPASGLLKDSLPCQEPKALTTFEEKLYALVGSFYEIFKMNADRFDRVDDYTKTVAIVPVSAKTGQGIPELLIVLMGLANRFLEQSLAVDAKSPSKGSVLEVKEEQGLGTVLDIIVYNGTLAVNDTLIIGGLEQPIVTKIKAMFEPEPLTEMRERKTTFRNVKKASAATGVRICAKDIADVISGMPVESLSPDAPTKDVEKAKARVQSHVESVLIETDVQGLIIKADALGSLEAMISLLKAANITIKRASIGSITKKDLIDAQASKQQDPLLGVVLGFNVKIGPGIDPGNITVITNEVIYKIIEDYESWKAVQQRAMTASELEGLTRPFKIELMRGYIFRQSNPAVAGVHVQAGILKSNVQVMKNNGKTLTSIKSIQLEKETVEQATKDQQVAVSLPHIIIGRHVNEGDILYSVIPETEFRKLKEFKNQLSKSEREVLKEIAEIMRKENPVWGV